MLHFWLVLVIMLSGLMTTCINIHVFIAGLCSVLWWAHQGGPSPVHRWRQHRCQRAIGSTAIGT